MTKSAGKRKGGLKSSLTSLQSRIHAKKKAQSAKHAQELKEKTAIRNVRAQGSSKRTHRAGQHQPVPFVSEWDNTLLIGEGNFSFARSIVQHHGIPGHRVTATAYDTEEHLFLKYPEARENLRWLREHGVIVLLHVDARTLHKSKALLIRSKQLGGFSRVVWNFPHAGAGIQDQDRNINVNQQLLLRFFQSVAVLLSTADKGPLSSDTSRGAGEEDSDAEESSKPQSDSAGRVLVTMRESVPYTLWEVPQLAKHPPPGHPTYQQVRSYAFEPSSYPGYEHRRTIGGSHSVFSANLPQESISDAGQVRASPCRTWEFTLKA
ncbi:hypothetical protein CALVIDRAFT_539466 [Calocera viscosa TUFC12733]|uniref:25S rRNA (uridine-N(3))-methyltransferase BMT5-like domain-containing protein n=1 Tax=Calocera viscosa (strain TUFC12733) TaxID=1330018 RepID=A0A167JZ84_CALVF|nr:hypothetical protein CALVIDRAFT_539466 [Calocera viscosa TUFC12733]